MEAWAELSSFPLLALPLELRQQIYDLALDYVPLIDTFSERYISVGDSNDFYRSITEKGLADMTLQLTASETLLENLLLTNRQVCGELHILVKKRFQ